MNNWDVDEVIKALEATKDQNNPRQHVDIKSLVGKTSRITIEAKIAQGIGKPIGKIRIDMITEIVNGGRAGIVPRTYFEVWERRVKINTYDTLEDALHEYNGRTGE